MGFYGDADIDSMLADCGVPVTLGSVTGSGVMNIVDQSLLPAGTHSLVGRVVTVHVRTGTFPTVAEGNAITVDGIAYRVISALAEADGALTVITCTRT